MSSKRKKVLIIIPAFNEGKNIGPLLEKLERKDISDICDVLVINDASTDDTGQVVRSRGHRVVKNVFNLGYGSGLQVGYIYAKRMGYKFVIQMDGITEVRGNRETDPAFCEALEHADKAGVKIRFLPCRVEPDSISVSTRRNI